MNVPELGVGIIYFSGFRNILESNTDLIHLIEIEPQTFWYRNRSESDSFVFNTQEINYLESIDKPKLFHGVGYPVGGSARTDLHHVSYLRQMIDSLKPRWLSEHLSFNTIEIEGEDCNTNFLLPPLQTEEGVELCVKNILNYSSHFDTPFAFETGTNYLSPYAFELDDGTYVNEIAERSDSWILLDIHNLLANQKNGRQSVRDFIKQINPSRVLQIHLAGGFYFDGYYLDAHSNVSSQEVIEIFETVVEILPNLKAITFEMLPEYVNLVSASAIKKQLETMNRIWDRRGRKSKKRQRKPQIPIDNLAYRPSIFEWESTLGKLVIGKHPEQSSPLDHLFKEDKGIQIMQSLVSTFRKSLLVGSLKMTCRYIMLSKGLDGFERLLKEFWQVSSPLLFASDNGLKFSQYLLKRSDLIASDNILLTIVNYEYATLQTTIDQKVREVNLQYNPMDILAPLADGQLPINLQEGKYIITIEPDEVKKAEIIQSVLHT